MLADSQELIDDKNATQGRSTCRNALEQGAVELDARDRYRVLVHLHLYYGMQLGYFLKKLRNLDSVADMRLIVTIPDNAAWRDKATRRILNEFPASLVIPLENRGFDMGPFVHVVNTVNLTDYDFVLKLHTKGGGLSANHALNSLQVSDEVWRRYLLESLIEDKDTIEHALGKLSGKGVGLVASGRCIVEDEIIRKRYYSFRVNDELMAMELPRVENSRFVAGGMFMTKAYIFAPLCRYSLDDFGKSAPGIHDYTLAHTFERLLSAMVVAQGLSLEGLESNERLPLVNIGKWLELSKRLAAKVDTRIRFHFEGESVIRLSEYFDESWYRQRYLDSDVSNPARHYLRKGFRKGFDPSPYFDGNAYIERIPSVKQHGYNPLLHYECYGRRRGIIPAAPQAIRNAGLDVIRSSKLFDPDWYLRNNPDVSHLGIDPAEHYLNIGGLRNRDPSPLFSNDEYLALNPDVRLAGINPLLHYEMVGKFEDRPLSIPGVIDLSEKCAAQRSLNRVWRVKAVSEGRLAIVSLKVRSAEIDAFSIALIREIASVADNVVVVGDAIVGESEADKLKELATCATFTSHGESRFGSYKLGIAMARDAGLFNRESISELCLIDASLASSGRPLSGLFEEMASRDCGFWTYESRGAAVRYHSSSFLVFRRQALESGLLEEFFSYARVDAGNPASTEYLEGHLSGVMARERIKGLAYVHRDELRLSMEGVGAILGQKPAYLLDAKWLAGAWADDARVFLCRKPKTLWNGRYRSPVQTPFVFPTPQEYESLLQERARKVGHRINGGGAALVAFLVTDPAMFPGRPLFDEMLCDTRFSPSIVVIPDYRWPGEIDERMNHAYRTISKMYPNANVSKAAQDRYGQWLHPRADIICYPSPYGHLSSYVFNPRRALLEKTLPIMINYGYYRSTYDRLLMGMQGYAYCWKVFLECHENLREYSTYSATKGSNAVVTGYVKMDRLAGFLAQPHRRPKILVALHHSVEGGFNDSLALANFVRYFDYFKGLPDCYPEVDFVYRPHPELFNALRKSRACSKSEIANFREEMSAKGNFTWSEGAEYFQEFQDSDACIQDCGSFLVEYLYTGKPCCYMLKDPGDIDKKFSKLGKKCLSACYVAYNEEEITSFIESVVMGGDDPKGTDRSRIAEQIAVNYPYAAKAALASIREGLFLDASRRGC